MSNNEVESNDPKLLLAASSFPPYVTPSAVLLKNIFDKYNGKIKAFGSTAFTKIDPAFEPPCEVKYIKFPNGRFAEAISRRFHHHFLFYYYRKLLKFCLDYKPDLIFSNYPRDVMLVAAYKVSKELKIPLYVYMHDLWHDNVIERAVNVGVADFARKWEPLILKNAKRVFCCTENAQMLYEKK